MKEQNWSHDDVFPIIAQSITSLHTSGREFVEHDDIVRSLLNDAEAANHIAAAREGNISNRSDEWIAHNMVAWFSQRITVGDSPYVTRFERKKIKNKWAYKPIS